MDNMNYNIVDLFAGAGGLSLGFIKNKFNLIFANDFDKNASLTFKHNHPNIPYLEEDIKEVSANQVKKIINGQKTHVLMAGIPCQSFSMAGYRIRQGIDNSKDPRHFLYKEYFRMLDILKPDIAVIENVKGILSSNDGLILNEIIQSYENRKYSVDYQLLDASEHGVPQSRQRVFIIGNKISQDNIFPKKQDWKLPVWEVLKDIPENAKNNNKKYFEGLNLERAEHLKPGENWTKLPKRLQTRSIHSGAYGRIDPNLPSRTLTTRFDTPSVGFVTHPYENRTITVREGARIQTFPDDFEFLGTKMSQYKQIGNAVPVQLAFEVSKGVKKMLNNFYENQK